MILPLSFLSFFFTIRWFLVYSQSCALTTVNIRIFYHPEETPGPLAISLISLLLPRPWTTTNLFSASVDLPILDISFKGNHTVRGLLSFNCNGFLHNALLFFSRTECSFLCLWNRKFLKLRKGIQKILSSPKYDKCPLHVARHILFFRSQLKCHLWETSLCILVKDRPSLLFHLPDPCLFF